MSNVPYAVRRARLKVRDTVLDSGLNGRELLRQRFCPLCGAGPFKSPLAHAAKAHDMSTRQVRDLIGMSYSETVCAESVSANNRASIEKVRAAGQVPSLEGLGQPFEPREFKPMRETEREQRRQIKAPGDKLSGVTHGRYNTYAQGCRCIACRAVNTARYHEQLLTRIPRKESAPHGTVSGYANWRCRCDLCRDVWRAEMVREKQIRDEKKQTTKEEQWKSSQPKPASPPTKSTNGTQGS